MPTTLSVSNESLIAFNCYRFVRLWAITLTNGTTLRFTDHNAPLSLDGNTYSPATFDATAGETKEGLSQNSVELRGYLASDAIKKEELRARLYADAEIDVMVVDWRYPYAGVFRRDVMKIENVKYTGEVWEATVLGLAGLLRRKVGTLLNRDCQVAQLGDADCGVDIESHRKTGEVVSVSSYARVFTTDLTDGDGLYDLGEITWTSGNNTGFTSEVKTYLFSSGTVTLQLRTPYEIEAGDEFSIIPGCNRTRDHCKGTSGTSNRPWATNILNFRGYPNMPGARVILKTPNR